MPALQEMPIGKYTITSIVPENDFNPTTGTVPSHRVSFTTEGGLSSSVLVPDTEVTNLTAVQTRVEGLIRALTAISKLGQ